MSSFSNLKTSMVTPEDKPNMKIKTDRHDLQDVAENKFWCLITFDHGLEVGIQVKIDNYNDDAWVLEIKHCQLLGITCEEEEKSLRIPKELMKDETLELFMTVYNENKQELQQYLERNVVPLVTRKIKYVWYKPQFKLFLSHKSENKPLMRIFKKGLEFLGYETWIDETDMPPGAQLAPALKTAIDGCHCLIAWITTQYMDSSYCQDELLYAKEKAKIIIPFGIMGDIKHRLTDRFEFLNKYFIFHLTSASFFEMLRRIDDALFEFENLPK